jgi:hypothetical protein
MSPVCASGGSGAVVVPDVDARTVAWPGTTTADANTAHVVAWVSLAGVSVSHVVSRVVVSASVVAQVVAWVAVRVRRVSHVLEWLAVRVVRAVQVVARVTVRTLRVCHVDARVGATRAAAAQVVARVVVTLVRVSATPHDVSRVDTTAWGGNVPVWVVSPRSRNGRGVTGMSVVATAQVVARVEVTVAPGAAGAATAQLVPRVDPTGVVPPPVCGPHVPAPTHVSVPVQSETVVTATAHDVSRTEETATGGWGDSSSRRLTTLSPVSQWTPKRRFTPPATSPTGPCPHRS